MEEAEAYSNTLQAEKTHSNRTATRFDCQINYTSYTQILELSHNFNIAWSTAFGNLISFYRTDTKEEYGPYEGPKLGNMMVGN